MNRPGTDQLYTLELWCMVQNQFFVGATSLYFLRVRTLTTNADKSTRNSQKRSVSRENLLQGQTTLKLILNERGDSDNCLLFPRLFWRNTPVTIMNLKKREGRKPPRGWYRTSQILCATVVFANCLVTLVWILIWNTEKSIFWIFD